MDSFSTNPIAVLIIASSPLARAGLAALLADRPRLEVVGQLAEHEAPDQAAIYRPDVIVWDCGYDPAERLPAIAELAARPAPVIGLFSDQDAALDAYAALMSAGVRGVLPGAIDGDALESAVVACALGLTVIGPLVSQALAERGLIPAAGQTADLALTPREHEVLALVAEGLPNKTIARQLAISEHTVKFHLNAILAKLGAQSRTEAVVRATRLGLLAL